LNSSENMVFDQIKTWRNRFCLLIGQVNCMLMPSNTFHFPAQAIHQFMH
jgi:hypothetical protein